MAQNMLHDDALILVTRRLLGEVPGKVGASLAVASQVDHEHTRVPRIQVGFQPVVAHHLLYGRRNVLPVILAVEALAHDDPHLRPALALALSHGLLGPLEGLRCVQTVQIHRALRRVFVVGHKDPIGCLLVETFHVGLVRISLVAELLGTRTIALSICLVRLIKALCHLVAFRACLVAQVEVVGIVLIDLIVL